MLLPLALAIVLAQETVPTAPSDIAPTPPPGAPAPAAPSAAPPTSSTAPLVGAPPGNPEDAPPLPEGALLPVARSDRGETFLVVSRFSRSGVVADFWTYDAFSAPIEVAPGIQVVQGLARRQIDCEKQTEQTFAQAGYDEGGKAVVALAAGPPTPLTDDSVGKLVAEAVCKGDTLPKEGQILGHAAALAAARAPAPG